MLLELLVCAAFAGCSGDGPDETPQKHVETAITVEKPNAVEWRDLAGSSLRFVGVMHGFRLLTEPGTRAGGFGLGTGYIASVTALHGWADGDPFYVNYVGHPMMGAVAGRLWSLHDRRYRRAEFGGSADYWKGKLRGAAFAWAFSEQFEIGGLSEASIGHIQKDFPQQGFVDHIVTPTVGLGWTLAEDALDRYLIKKMEARWQNRFARIAARTLLNPARTFANAMDWKVPWYRDSRSGVLSYVAAPAGSRETSTDRFGEPVREVAPFEFATLAGARQVGGNSCVGGGGEAAYRVAADWQMVLAVNGCKLVRLSENVSGDALAYQLGPRWTPSPSGKWSPFAHLLVGGLRLTQETLDPEERKLVMEANKDLDPMLFYTLHGKYTSQKETNGLAVTAGMGVDYRFNPALAIRVASLEYLHSRSGTLGGGGFQMTTGMVLRWGTW